MEIRVEQRNVDEIGYREELTHEIIGGQLISSRITEDTKEEFYFVEGDEVRIKRKWRIRDDAEKFYTNGEYDIVFKRKWNVEWNTHEDKIFVHRINYLYVEREYEDGGEWRKEVLKWNIDNAYYYSEVSIDDELGTFFKLETDMVYRVKKIILDKVKSWHYVVI